MVSCTFFPHMTTPSLDIICKTIQVLQLHTVKFSVQTEKIDSLRLVFPRQLVSLEQSYYTTIVKRFQILPEETLHFFVQEILEQNWTAICIEIKFQMYRLKQTILVTKALKCVASESGEDFH